MSIPSLDRLFLVVWRSLVAGAIFLGLSFLQSPATLAAGSRDGGDRFSGADRGRSGQDDDRHPPAKSSRPSNPSPVTPKFTDAPRTVKTPDTGKTQPKPKDTRTVDSPPSSRRFSKPDGSPAPKADTPPKVRTERKDPPGTKTDGPNMSEIRKRLEQGGTKRTPPSDRTVKPDLGKLPAGTGAGLAKPSTIGLPKPSTIGKPMPGVIKGDVKDLGTLRFSERYKSGQLEHLTKGETAQKLRLAEQYKLFQQGDVARRLELQNHVDRTHNVAQAGNLANLTNVRHNANVAKIFGPNYHYYHGWVNPSYAQNCFRHHYWGPGFFAGVCWYPHWHPWVNWSWHHHCHVFWDPRPIWCRPVIYDPCARWIWWETPVWLPLPMVACGTWVDVQPVAVPAAQYDLQLLAVRFVDPGHPEEKLGPRYRVWFRNNSDRPVTQPFNVMLFASNDGRPTANLPQAGVRVTSVEAGDTQSVDVRLPFEVSSMSRDANGSPAPFSTLCALVDANREVPETTRTNNGARVARAEILPVDPATFAAEPKQAPAGSEIILAGEGFGPQPGQVVVHLGGLELEGEILGWYDLGVRLRLPNMPLASPTAADVIVVRGDGAAANPLKVTVTPPQAAPATQEVVPPSFPAEQ